ncbi:MAG: hypothetical protein LBC03_05280 [Nitrososphaerota archaeon]|jgi:N-acetylneuraminic acid mutarotase|nr:hypothetical protein [Nitrososphaerota archaeon]
MNKALTFTLIFFFVCSSFTIVFSYVSASDAAGDYWNTKTPMKQARSGLGVIAVDGKIYAIGGYGNGGWGIDAYVATNERYDPKTDTWTTLASMPTRRSDFAIAAYEGKIYAIGGGTSGKNGLNDLLNVTEVYDIASNSWSTKAALPFNGKSLHANVVDGRIFVVGARDSFKYGSPQDLYVYDPVKALWTQKTSMPRASPAGNFIVSAVVDDKIIFAGEFTIGNTDVAEQKVLIYDTKTDSWSEGKAGPTQVWCGGAGATTGVYAPKNVYTLGITSNTVYDPIKNSWLSAKAMPTERANFGVAVVDDILYVIGGFTSTDFHAFGTPTEPSRLNEQYVPIGFHGTLPTTTSPVADSTPSDSVVSSESGSSDSVVSPQLEFESKSAPSMSFLIESVGAIVVITSCVVITTLFFLFKRTKKEVK